MNIFSYVTNTQALKQKEEKEEEFGSIDSWLSFFHLKTFIPSCL